MSVEDRLAIHEIIARYSHTYDGQDAEGFAQLFVEEGFAFEPDPTPEQIQYLEDRLYEFNAGATRMTELR